MGDRRCSVRTDKQTDMTKLIVAISRTQLKEFQIRKEFASLVCFVTCIEKIVLCRATKDEALIRRVVVNESRSTH